MLSGEKLLGIPILISYTESEKNRLAEEAAEATRKSKLPDSEFHRLYVGSIHPNITEESLTQLFAPYGVLESVQLHKDPVTNKSKGFAFVHFKNHSDAKRAMEQLNGLELAGVNIRVGIVSEKPNNGQQPTTSLTLDDSDTLGMALTAQSRTELMLKLARDTDLVDKVPLSIIRPNMANVSSEPTVFVVLANVYDPDQ